VLPRPHLGPMRRGVTLLELVFVLAIIGVMAGIVVPSASYLADRLAVEHQAARILSAYRSAWLTARMQHRLALLRVTADTLAIRTVRSAGAPDTTLVWVATGPALAGVALTSASHTTVFAPDGVAMGLSNTSHTLRKGGAKRQVVVSRLGRVRIAP
jgi:prepilin-type N-terminal cleavage/methylation domain-containing protein